MPAPTKYPDWATDGTNTVEPPAGKVAAGWVPGEQPPAGWFNWWQNLVGQWSHWLDGAVTSLTGRVGALETDMDAVQSVNGSQDAALTSLADAAHKNQSNTFTQGQTISSGGLAVQGESGEINADSHINGGKSVYAGTRGLNDGNPNHSWEFLYGQVRQRTVTIGLASGCGGFVLFANEGEFFSLDPAQTMIYPLAVPHGAQMRTVIIKRRGGVANVAYTMKLKRRHNIVLSGGAPTYATIQTVNGTAQTAVADESSFNFGGAAGMAASSQEDYSLYILCDNGGPGPLYIYSITFVYDEQFVRTFGSR